MAPTVWSAEALVPVLVVELLLAEALPRALAWLALVLRFRHLSHHQLLELQLMLALV